MSSRRRRARRKKKSYVLSPAVTGAVTLGIAALATPSASAATFTVSNLNDNGPGSLRDAVVAANANAGADVIQFQPGLTGTITLTTGELDLYDAVDIQGPGAGVITVSGNDSSRVFYVYSSAAAPLDVTISGLTLTHGFDGSFGGAVADLGENLTLDHVVVSDSVVGEGIGGGVAKEQSSGTLHILNSTITGNSAGLGGGIFLYSTDAAADIQDSVISNNTASASGGGIYLYNLREDLTIARTTISGNHADCCGGGIFLYNTSGGSFTVDSSTISGNSAANAGGGMFLYYINDPINIQNSTVSGNSASYVGGIFLYSAYSDATLSFTTVTGNTASGQVGGVFVYGGALAVNDSIIGGNSAPSFPDVAGDGIFILNYSLVQDTTNANVTANPGSITGVSPNLGPLANNGGPTQTHLPNPGSPVINAGDPAFVPPPATDQRGLPRVAGGRVDMGAVEVNGGAFQFSAAAYPVNENGGSVTITVTRTGGTDPATVSYATSNGSATAGADYTATSGTLNFIAGQTSATFNVPILDDNLVEGTETINLTLSSPSAGATLGAQSTAVVSIADVEPGVLQFSNPTYTVAENGASILITVTRTNGSTGAVSVSYATSNGTASAGADYTASSGTLNFAAGQTSATFSVPILDDNLVEGNETFNLTLSAPTGGATLGAQSSAVVTIMDVEPGALQFSSATYTVAENGASILITVNRTGGSTGAVSVNYATSNGTATAGADYTSASGTLNFADGQTSATFSVPILDDNLVEGNETFNLTLSAPAGGAALGAQSGAVVTITDFEAGSVQFSVATAQVNEGSAVTLTVTRTGGSSGPLLVNYSTSGGTATSGTDFVPASGTVAFADGDAAPKTVVIQTNSDATPEPPETFTATLSAPSAGSLGTPSTATVTINDPSTIPVFGAIGKLLLALFTAITGVFMINRNRLSAFFLAALLAGLAAAPLHAQHAAPRGLAGKQAKSRFAADGNLQSVAASGASVVLTLTGGQSVTLSTAKLKVVDLRGKVRKKSTLDALTPGMHVKVVQGVVPKIKILK